MKLWMVLLGAKPNGRHTEQHDVYIGIAQALKDLIPAFEEFWPEAAGKMHVDGFRSITSVGDYEISVLEKTANSQKGDAQLFFINLGGYKRGEFEEFHYKMLIAAKDKSTAISMAKQTAFFKHTHFEGANSHIDDKYGIDVDDVYEIEDLLPPLVKEKYSVRVSSPVNASAASSEDELQLGYFKLDAL